MKKKIIALVLCLTLMAGIAIPGTLATGLDTAESSSDFAVEPSTTETPSPSEAPVCTCPDMEGVDKTAEDYVHVKGCAFYVPVCTCEATEEEKDAEGFVHAKGCDFYVPVCTCEATEEEKAAEGFTHSEGCDFYVVPVDPNVELYEKLMAAATAEELLALTEGLSEEEANAFAAALTDEQLAALRAHIQSIAPEEEHEPPQSVVFTDAGPFMPAVTVETSRRMRFALRSTGVETDNGLELSKEATANGDGSYTIRMEAYTTGTVTTTTKMVPVDIVLVLDQSGSMAYDFDGNSTSTNTARRQYAMKQAVNNFISSVSEKYSSEADHRISVVTFGSSASTLQGWTYVDEAGKTTLQGKISSLPDSPSGATNVAAGMTQAETLMGSGYSYTGTNTQRQKVVIVFTDGVPTTDSDFDTTVATNAIVSAKRLKDGGATVYTVGIFTGANPNELYGASGFDTNSDGTVGSKWIMDAWGFFPGTDFPEADRPAGNRFLNYLSSNCPEAASIGLTRDTSGWGILHYKITYEITINYSRTADNYYLTANDSTSLNEIFQTISNNIQSANIDLGSKTVVKDTVSKYFDLPESTSDIRLYTAAAKADGTFENAVPASGLNAVIENGTVSVTGFDFNKNFVSDKLKDDGTYGTKLIIEFVVTPKEGFVGGNDVPTNDWENSGVYDQNGTEVEKFANADTTPTVNVPIVVPEFTVNNKTIYQGNSTPAAGLYTLPDTTGWQFDYVNVNVAGVAGENISPADCTDYKITVTYLPKTDGGASSGTPNEMTGVSREKTAAVHILKPTVTASVNDVQKYYGESYTLGEGVSGSVDVTWTDKNSHPGIPAAEGTQPYGADDLELNYSFTNTSASSVTVPATDFDVMVKVVKKADDTKVPATITTTCSYGCANETDGKYTVHVKTCNLTITKAGNVDENEGFIFNVTGPDNMQFTVSVKGNGTAMISGLPIGTYSVAEDTSWSWRYTASVSPASVELSSTNPSSTVTVTNTKGNSGWLSGEAYAQNFVSNTPAEPAP